MARSRPESFPCPNCGADVRAGARSCPECGSDDETGWSDDTLYDGLDLPDPALAVDEAPRRGRATAGRIVAALVLIAVVLFLLLRAW